RRLTEISLKAANSPVMVWSLLSKTSSTVACETGLREVEPEKITSVSESPRRRLAELSPITLRTASMMFDLPQPLGPTTPVMLVGRWSVVGSTNDLKPESLIVDRRMRRSVASAAHGRAVAAVGCRDGQEECGAGPHRPEYNGRRRAGPGGSRPPQARRGRYAALPAGGPYGCAGPALMAGRERCRCPPRHPGVTMCP